MPLKNKYLRYTPEITFEIFSLVWNSLNTKGWRPYCNINITDTYQIMSTSDRKLLIWEDNDKKLFNTHSTKAINSLDIETTVQEILEYNPFVKDEFVLPEKWFIKTTEDSNDLIVDWIESKHKNRHDRTIGNYFTSDYRGWMHYAPENVRSYKEITFDQFKKYVLKEPIEKDWLKVNEEELLQEARRRYPIGCKINSIKGNGKNLTVIKDNFTVHNTGCKIGITVSTDYANGTIVKNGCSIFADNKWAEIISLPETKEQSKSIEKWSVGSYVVFLCNYLQSNGFLKGDIQKIFKLTNLGIIFDNGCGNTTSDNGIASQIKWFATLQEAEEFAKTLVEPVKEVVQLTAFPTEGYCKTDNKELRRYLIKRPNTTLSGEPKWIEGRSIGVGWNERSHWIISEKSSKPEYQLNQLERFFTKEEAKQPLKQAVHCTTQEEWDFVSEKIGYKFTTKFELGNNDTINPVSKSCESKLFFERRGEYNLLSFQEWCDLNGYKMKKEVKLNVNKWYCCKSNYNWYFKYIQGSAERPQAYEWIDLDEHKYKKYTKLTHLTNPNNIREVSLEEIQQYLPEGHPDKIKTNQEFKVGEYIILENAGGWSYSKCNNGCLGLITKIGGYVPDSLKNCNYSVTGKILNSNNNDKTFKDIPVGIYEGKVIVRHATPEEINQHLISIGQIPAGEPLNTGIEPNKDGMFKYTTYAGTTYTGKCSTVSGPLKLILSIDDEELPMVSIIKTKKVNLLNND